MLDYRLTPHAEERMHQRCIHDEDIAIALWLGEASHSYGDVVYTLTDRCLRGTRWERKADRLRGLAVVLTDDGWVRTVMWNDRVRHRAGVLRRGQVAA